MTLRQKPSWMSQLEWDDNVNRGLRWCHRDQTWEPVARFGVDRSRFDQLTTSCRRSLRAGKRPRP